MQVEAEQAGTVSAQVELTVTALADQATLAILQNTPDPSPTTTPLPTEAPTPTPAVVRIGVSTNTNCRTGPATAYERQGALLVGETTEVIAKSNFEDYWYVAYPACPGEFCWL